MQEANDMPSERTLLAEAGTSAEQRPAGCLAGHALKSAAEGPSAQLEAGQQDAQGLRCQLCISVRLLHKQRWIQRLRRSGLWNDNWLLV